MFGQIGIAESATLPDDWWTSGRSCIFSEELAADADRIDVRLQVRALPMALSKDSILAELCKVALPEGGNIVSDGMVRALTVNEGEVSFVLEVPPGLGPKMEPVRRAAEQAVKEIPAVSKVMAVMTSHQETARSQAARGRDEPPNLRIGRHPTGGTKKVKLPGVARIIAVASGKGGVGKSTVASNLAVALARKGIRTGLLDADIHGPSLPKMMGVSSRPQSAGENRIRPLTAHGIVMMSVGLLLPSDEAVIWRGPMLMGALQQMLQQVDWGELDILVVDLPPGTGDVQLTLCQRFELAGAVIVCTPQEVALMDARRAISMFGRLKAPILGMIENMSYFECPSCGHRTDLFGSGRAKALADLAGIPFLGQIPMDASLRISGDSGKPVALGEGPLASAFRTVADALA